MTYFDYKQGCFVFSSDALFLVNIIKTIQINFDLV